MPQTERPMDPFRTPRNPCISREELHLLDGALHFEYNQLSDALERAGKGAPSPLRHQDNKHLSDIAELISWLEYQIVMNGKICGVKGPGPSSSRG